MEILSFLLLLTVGLTMGQLDLPQAGYQVHNWGTLQFFTWNPSTTATGVLPTHAIMVVQYPRDVSSGVNAGSYKFWTTVSLVGVELDVPGELNVVADWVPFVPFMMRLNINNRGDRVQFYRKAQPMPIVYPYNAADALTNGCHLEAFTSESGKSLVLVFTSGATYANCHFNDNIELTYYIPQHYLTPNPAFPDTRITMGIYTAPKQWVKTGLNYVPALPKIINGFVVSSAVPYTTTDAAVQLSMLTFHHIVPSSTISGATLTSLQISLTLGINVLAGGSLMLMVSAPIFQDLPSINSLGLPFVVIGYGNNCMSGKPSPFCCWATTAFTRLSLGVFGLDSSASSEDLNLGGWSVMSFTLGPVGCMLPADKRITFNIPQQYLGANPTLLDPTGWQSYSYAFRSVNAKFATSSEPGLTWVRRYTAPEGPFYTLQVQSYRFTSSIDSPNFAPYQVGWQSFTTYIVGTSTVSSFVVVVDTLIAGLTPSFMKISFVLNTDFVYPDGITPPGVPYTPQRISITGTQGVFKPNQGTVELPNFLARSSFRNACGANWFTNSWSTLFVMPNPNWDVDCNSDLAAGTTVIIWIPSSALLPNPPANTVVTFDIRVIPWFSFQFGELGNGANINRDGVTIANTVDGATLMNQFGYTTVAVCRSMPMIDGRLGEISMMTIHERCLFVDAISLLSPISAALLRCSISSMLAVTYVKVPESMWTQEHWPLTNIAAESNWPQIAGVAGTPDVQIRAFGFMISYPMFAVVVVYPSTVQSLQALGVNANVPTTWTVGFVVRLDRITLACQIANDDNPWVFDVATACNIVEVNLFLDHLVLGAPGAPLSQVPGSHWKTGNGRTIVTASSGGAVVGYCTAVVSPAPEGSDSDDALFGLLALIAIPVLLCCCLLALLWFLRPKTEPCPCVPEYPVQEMYWVNAQPAAPVYTMEPAVCVAAPPATPIYLVQ